MELLKKALEAALQAVVQDDKEWDADDIAGDESAYDGLAVETIPYDHSQFEEETNGY